MTTTDAHRTQRAEYIAGLRAFADLLESTPDLALPTHGGVASHTALKWLYFGGVENPKAAAADVVRRMGGAWDKDGKGDDLFEFSTSIRGLHLEVVVERETVCERVVTGTAEVIEQVPDPDYTGPAVPMVEVTKTVETFEWVCKPLLAEVQS